MATESLGRRSITAALPLCTPISLYPSKSKKLLISGDCATSCLFLRFIRGSPRFATSCDESLVTWLQLVQRMEEVLYLGGCHLAQNTHNATCPDAFSELWDARIFSSPSPAVLHDALHQKHGQSALPSLFTTSSICQRRSQVHGKNCWISKCGTCWTVWTAAL